jgi:hypothetical protein
MKGIDQLSVRIQLIEGLFMKYANAVEHKVMGQHSSDKTMTHLRESSFICKILPTAKK